MDTIFISYPTEDQVIAKAMVDAIKAMPENTFEVFFDRLSIGAGSRISNGIRTALKDTYAFVAIGTDVVRRNFDWCGEELGFYQASNPEDNDRREICLYHKSIPSLFVDRKSHQCVALKPAHVDEFGYPIYHLNQSPFHQFLNELAKWNAERKKPQDPLKYWNDVAKWSEIHTNEITDSFYSALQNRVRDEWYPQARIEISIDDGDFYTRPPAEIPDNACVILKQSAYKLFNAAAPNEPRSVSWSLFRNYITDKTGSDTLCTLISTIVVRALPDKDEASNDFVFQAPNGKFYRVLLARHASYGNGKRDIVINLIETLDKVQSGNEETTALIAGIVLGSKFRSLFVETGAKYEKEKLSGLTDDALRDTLDRMLRDIDRVQADSASDGLADQTSLERIFGERLEVEDMYTTWNTAFPPMDSAAKEYIRNPSANNKQAFFDAYNGFLAVSQKNNRTFLELCWGEYSKHFDD